jgi:hypothetical protein
MSVEYLTQERLVEQQDQVGHVEGDLLVEGDVSLVVVLLLEEFFQLQGGLEPLVTVDLSFDGEFTNVAHGEEILDLGLLVLVGSSFFDDLGLAQLLVAELDGLLLVLGLLASVFTATLQVLLVLVDLVADVLAVLLELLDSSSKSFNFLLLLQDLFGTVGNFSANVLQERGVVVLSSDHLSLVELSNVLQSLGDVLLQVGHLVVVSELLSLLQNVHQGERRLGGHRDLLEAANDDLLGLFVELSLGRDVFQGGLELGLQVELDVLAFLTGIVRNWSEVLQDDANRVLRVSSELVGVSGQSLVSVDDFLSSDQDQRLGADSQLHVLVDLQVLFGLSNVDQLLQQVQEVRLVLDDPVVHGEVRISRAELAKVESLLKDFTDSQQVLSQLKRQVSRHELEGLRLRQGQVNVTVVHEVTDDLPKLLLVNLGEALSARLEDLLADQTKTVGHSSQVVLDSLDEVRAELGQLTSALVDDLPSLLQDFRVFVHRLLATLLVLLLLLVLLVRSGIGHRRSQLGNDLLQVDVQVQVVLGGDLLDNRTNGGLQVLSTLTTLVVSQNHSVDNRRGFRHVLGVASVLNLSRDAHLEEFHNQKLFSGGEDVTVEGTQHALHKRSNLSGVSQVSTKQKKL